MCVCSFVFSFSLELDAGSTERGETIVKAPGLGDATPRDSPELCVYFSWLSFFLLPMDNDIGCHAQAKLERAGRAVFLFPRKHAQTSLAVAPNAVNLLNIVEDASDGEQRK
jgi:hypothetical protein